MIYNEELITALRDIKVRGLADISNKKDAQLMLFKRGETPLAMLLEEFTEDSYEELAKTVNGVAHVELVKGADIEEHIRAKAKEMNATIESTMSIKEALTILDETPEIIQTMGMLINRRTVDKYPRAFYNHIQRERDSMEAGVSMIKEALMQAPKLSGVTNGQQVEKDIYEIWADYKEQLSVKKFIEDNKENADELAKIRLTNQLQFINASLNMLDDFLSHSMIVMATKN